MALQSIRRSFLRLPHQTMMGGGITRTAGIITQHQHHHHQIRMFASAGGVFPGPPTPYIFPEETNGEIPWDRDYWNPQPYRDPLYKNKWPSPHHHNIVPVTQMLPGVIDLDAADRSRLTEEAVYRQKLQTQEDQERERNPDKFAAEDAKIETMLRAREESLRIPTTPSILNAEQLERYRKFWDDAGNPLPNTELPESRLIKE